MTDPGRYYFSQDVAPKFDAKAKLERKFHRIRPEANIWALGAVMWSLVTLGEIEELSERVDNVLRGKGLAAHNFDGKIILRQPGSEITERYSPKLWELIE